MGNWLRVKGYRASLFRLIFLPVLRQHEHIIGGACPPQTVVSDGQATARSAVQRAIMSPRQINNTGSLGTTRDKEAGGLHASGELFYSTDHHQSPRKCVPYPRSRLCLYHVKRSLCAAWVIVEIFIRDFYFITHTAVIVMINMYTSLSPPQGMTFRWIHKSDNFSICFSLFLCKIMVIWKKRRGLWTALWMHALGVCKLGLLWTDFPRGEDKVEKKVWMAWPRFIRGGGDYGAAANGHGRDEHFYEWFEQLLPPTGLIEKHL